MEQSTTFSTNQAINDQQIQKEITALIYKYQQFLALNNPKNFNFSTDSTTISSTVVISTEKLNLPALRTQREEAIQKKQLEIENICTNILKTLEKANTTNLSPFCLRIEKIFSFVFQKDPITQARLLNQIAKVFFKHGDYNSSLDYYQKSLKILDSQPSSTLGQTYYEFSIALYHQKRFLEAGMQIDQALAIFKKFYHDNDLHFSRTFEIQGHIFCKRLLYSLALDSYKAALKIKCNIFGPNHKCTIKTKERIKLVKQKSAAEVQSYSTFGFLPSIAHQPSPIRTSYISILKNNPSLSLDDQ
jgi:tetratricopeptide (TPR) repeat protein